MIGSSENVLEDFEHINKIFNGPLDYKQLVNLTEAGVIFYLQPAYNIALKKYFLMKMQSLILRYTSESLMEFQLNSV